MRGVGTINLNIALDEVSQNQALSSIHINTTLYCIYFVNTGGVLTDVVAYVGAKK